MSYKRDISIVIHGYWPLTCSCFWEAMKLYYQFIILAIAQGLQIHPHWSQRPDPIVQLIPWLLMIWRSRSSATMVLTLFSRNSSKAIACIACWISPIYIFIFWFYVLYNLLQFELHIPFDIYKYIQIIFNSNIEVIFILHESEGFTSKSRNNGMHCMYFYVLKNKYFETCQLHSRLIFKLEIGQCFSQSGHILHSVFQ